MLPCPRRIESSLGAHNPEEDHWEEDDTCSWCGSLNPDTLLMRLEQGDVSIGPTDKNYKIYLQNEGGPAFLIRYKKRIQGTVDSYEWVLESRDWCKFYFQHFNMDQRQHFVDLLNKGKVQFGPPGHFYVMPYFIV